MSASKSACSSTSPPREVLISSAPARIAASRSRSMRLRVSSFSTVCSAHDVALGQERSRLASSTSARGRSASDTTSCARYPAGEAPTAAAQGHAPRGQSRRCRPSARSASVPAPGATRRRAPSALTAGRWRSSASMKASASSDTERALVPRDQASRTPWRSIASRSSMSIPTPTFEIARSSGRPCEQRLVDPLERGDRKRVTGEVTPRARRPRASDPRR